MTGKTFLRLSTYLWAIAVAALVVAGTLPAAGAPPAAGSSAANPPKIHLLWQGDVSDDDSNTARDYETGLGTFGGCYLEIKNKHRRNRLDVQFSYTGLRSPRITFVADVRKTRTDKPLPRIVQTLDSTSHKVWYYETYIPKCETTYFIYVGYLNKK